MAYAVGEIFSTRGGRSRSYELADKSQGRYEFDEVELGGDIEQEYFAPFETSYSTGMGYWDAHLPQRLIVVGSMVTCDGDVVGRSDGSARIVE